MSNFDFVPHKAFFTLAEVAELTGFALKALQQGCRSRRHRHQRLGRRYTMTRDQVIELLIKTEVTPAEAAPSDPAEARVLAHKSRVAAKLGRKNTKRPVAA